MTRRVFCKFLLIAIAVFCILALIMPDASFAQGKSQNKKVLISFRQIPGPNERALVRAAGGVIKHSYRLVPGIAASVPEAAIDGLSHNPNITMIEDDLTIYAVDIELDHCWGVERIGAGTVHASGNTGDGVKVAIIDSGIDYTHPDLNANYVDGYDFVNGDDDPMDDHGHGTHCSGIVAAEDNGTGAVGVAPDADLYGLKVLSASGSGSYSNVIAALEWAILNGIQVTSNSYGSSGYPGWLVEYTFDLAADSGIINVCAAGNSGNYAGTGENMIYPAKFASCISVAATTISDVRASFSSTGQQMEIAAPGAGIYSTVPGGGYQSWSGTSMACPHVSGVVALMIKAGVADIRGTLAATAEDLGAPGWDPQYGYGLVNAVAAVGEPGDPEPDPVVAQFVGDPTNGDTDLTVYFTDLSTGNPTSWLWDFGDTGTSTAQDPSHTYTAAGTYTVSLTATGPGGSDTETKVDYIEVTEPATPPPAPEADFSGSPTSGNAPLNVDFTDQSNGIVTSWSWTFGDGGTSTAENPSHTYTSAGNYTVSLTVSNAGGSDTLTRTNYITVSTPTITSIHVDSITVVAVKANKGQKGGYAEVVIVDNLGNPVQGASVTGSFSEDIDNSGLTVTTNPSGVAEFMTNDTVKGRAHLMFCVDSVSNSLPYNSGDNVEKCDTNY
jgi:PKD repeat protein